MLQRIAAGDLDVVGIEHVIGGDGAARDGILEDFGQRGAGFHGAGDEFGVLVVNRPQLVFDLFGQVSVRRLEPRPRACFCMLAERILHAPMLSSVALRLSFSGSLSASGPQIRMPCMEIS
jgi:hypothetical protein